MQPMAGSRLLNGNWRSFSNGIGARLSNLGTAGLAGREAAGWAQRLPEVACLGLIVAIAYVLARLTWLAVPGTTAAAPAKLAAAPAAPAPAGAGAAETAARIASLHLFGQASAAGTPSDQPVNAPETNLDVTLRGIIAASDSDESRALIVAGNGHGAGKSYRIGARIPGGAAIHGIYPDRVILERNGRLETLKLPRSDHGTGGVTRVPVVRTPPATRSTPPPKQTRSQPRNSRRMHISDFIRAQPAVVDGKVVGYRVYPGTNPAEFLQTGLKPGDVVKAVNGRPLSSPSSVMGLMKELKGNGPIRLKVERGGQTRQVTVSVSK